MTSIFDAAPRHAAPKAPSRAAKGLLSTIPIVVAGSMAMTMGLTGPIAPVAPKKAEKPRTSPSELARTVRDALSIAGRKPAPAAPTVTEGSVAVTAVAPATYRVAAGDTISGIAGRYGLATASVLALNGLGWKSVIYPGQVLKLGAGATPQAAAAPTPSSSSRYTIQRGDTISHIATKFGVTVQAVLTANGLGWSSIIYPGQTLAIPGAGSPTSLSVTPVSSVTPATPPTPAAGTSYVIQTGDTVSSIAAKFGTTAAAVLAANGMSATTIIYPGRSLKIPGGTMVAAASVTITPAAGLTPEMATNARTIISIGRSLGVSNYGIVIALAAAAQESGLRNLNYGDRDSLGLFQQRPSAGWGTKSQLLDPTYATRLFYGGPKNPNAGNTRGLLDISGWQTKTVTQAAQAVQRSAYPDAYAKWETFARGWLATLG